MARGQGRGDITIKGVRRRRLTGTVTWPITDPYGSERIGLKLDTTIDRNEFGVNWNVPLPDGKPALATTSRSSPVLQFVKWRKGMKSLRSPAASRRDSSTRSCSARRRSCPFRQRLRGVEASRPSRPTTTTTTSSRRRLRSSSAARGREADAVLFATPEYNSSVPGALKNALDWVSRPIATNPIRNIPVAVIGARHRRIRSSLGAGRASQGACSHGRARRGCGSGSRPLPTRFSDDGRLEDESALSQLAES